MLSSKKLNFQNPVSVLSQNSSAAIANSICCIQVLEDHNRTSNLKFQLCQWKCPRVDLIQVLHRIVEQRIIFFSLLRGWNKVNTVKHLSSTRKLGKNCLIELIDLLVDAGKNDALREVMIGLKGNVNVRIDDVNERIHRVFRTVKVVREGDVERIISVFTTANLQLPPCKVGLFIAYSPSLHLHRSVSYEPSNSMTL